MQLETARPFTGRKLERLVAFLHESGLDYDDRVSFSVCVYDEDELVATGSRDGAVLKCIAVRRDRQGEGLTATVLTELRRDAFDAGIRHLFLYTKPENETMFAPLGFYEVARTADTLLMEDAPDGALRFARSLRAPDAAGIIGAVVVNCNPFTKGHRYLIERASRACDTLYVFVLSEDRSFFPAADRMELVREGTRDLANVRVCPTGDYMISQATFPTYFIKDKARAPRMQLALDLAVFAGVFARELRITRRFVGTEPNCAVTASYNAAMHDYLPPRGIEVTELPRIEQNGEPISASRVRALLLAGDYEGLRPLVPDTTYEYLTHKWRKEHAVL